MKTVAGHPGFPRKAPLQNGHPVIILRTQPCLAIVYSHMLQYTAIIIAHYEYQHVHITYKLENDSVIRRSDHIVHCTERHTSICKTAPRLIPETL